MNQYPGVVAVEVAGDRLKLFFHDGAAGFRIQELPFSPWALAASQLAEQLQTRFRVIELSGSNHWKYRIEFDSVQSWETAVDELKKENDFFLVRDLIQQALTASQVRLFSGLAFPELRRMQFTVIPSADGKSIAEIQIKCNDTITIFTVTDEITEKSVIASFNQAVTDFDPDLLEGFNCCRNDLPLLEKRAKKFGFEFTCGRDGGTFSKRASRFQLAEKSISYNRYSLHGRHLIDLLHPVMLYDAAHRDFEDFSLEYLAGYFNIQYRTATEITDGLSNRLLPAYFYRCNELPLTLQDAVLRGTGAALDALFIALYQQDNRSIPLPEAQVRFAGALAAAEKHGVFKNVRHCDVRSLYPSILLHLKRSPQRDDAGVFLQKLAQLRQFRLEAKDKARSLPPGAAKTRFEALQSSCKILINSFYGYLGFAQGSFNDFALAAEVTARGRELLGKLAERLGSLGAEIIEMDTDGIYFCMPQQSDDNFDAEVAAVLPEGIEIEFDENYPAMYSYKTKNYALLHQDGHISVTGAAFKSRAMEKFQREFIARAIEAKLLDKPELMESAYQTLRTAILDKTIAIADLAKSETLSDSPENYRKKLAASSSPRRSAVYELALDSGKKFRTGDIVRFYMTGSKANLPVVGNSKLLDDADPANRDENSAWYVAKLDELYRKLS